MAKVRTNLRNVRRTKKSNSQDKLAVKNLDTKYCYTLDRVNPVLAKTLCSLQSSSVQPKLIQLDQAYEGILLKTNRLLILSNVGVPLLFLQNFDRLHCFHENEIISKHVRSFLILPGHTEDFLIQDENPCILTSLNWGRWVVEFLTWGYKITCKRLSCILQYCKLTQRRAH